MREIHLKDHVLITYSAIIEKEEYHWLKELLNSYDEISTEIVEKLDASKQNFFDNVLPLLKRQALNEWEVTSKDIVIKDLGEERQKCSICHTNIRYVCYIKNKFNNNELQIGKTCAEHFGFNGNKSIKELIKEAKRLRRITIIDEFIPGIDNIIQSWKEVLNDFEVIIPAHLEDPYTELYDRTKNLYESYLDEKKDNESFAEIKKMVEQKNNMVKVMASYDEKYKIYVSIPKIEVKTWLKNHNLFDILTELKDNKTYSIKTIHKVKEPKFMNDISNEINKKILHQVRGKIKKVNIEQYSYNYIFDSHPKIQLTITHERLLLEYGYLLFSQEPVKELNKYNLLNMSKIMATAYDSAINIFNQLLNGTIYSTYDYDIDFNDIYIKEGSKYYNYNLSEVFKHLKYAIFNLENADKIYEYFSKSKVKPMKKADVDELLKNR